MSTLSTESMDNVQGVHGHSPGRQWTMCTESMDIVQSEWAPWVLSRVSMDIVQTFHLVHGHSPGIPWTLSRETVDNVYWIHGYCPVLVSSLDCPLNPWTLSRLSTDSMDNVQGVHGHWPGSPWIQWTFYRQGIPLHQPLETAFCILPCKETSLANFNLIILLHSKGRKKCHKILKIGWQLKVLQPKIILFRAEYLFRSKGSNYFPRKKINYNVFALNAANQHQIVSLLN